jgi:hypothetical protein
MLILIREIRELLWPIEKISKKSLLRYLNRFEMDKECDRKGNRWARGE